MLELIVPLIGAAYLGYKEVPFYALAVWAVGTSAVFFFGQWKYFVRAMSPEDRSTPGAERFIKSMAFLAIAVAFLIVHSLLYFAFYRLAG